MNNNSNRFDYVVDIIKIFIIVSYICYYVINTGANEL